MKCRHEAEAGFNPPLEDRAFNGITLKQPAAQKTQIAVFEAFAPAGGILLFPLMQLKAHIHKVMKTHAALIRYIDGVQHGQKFSTCMLRSLDFKRLWIAVILQRADGPRR